jgi:hypothetical protein
MILAGVVGLVITIAACSGPNLAADRAAVNNAQNTVNVDRAALIALQPHVVLCVAGHCPPITPETPQHQQQVTQAHQRLVTALLRLQAAKDQLQKAES